MNTTSIDSVKFKLNSIIVAIVSLLWAAVIMIDYHNKHLLHELEISHFKYPLWSLGFVVICSLGYFLVKKYKIDLGPAHFLSIGIFLSIGTCIAYRPFSSMEQSLGVTEIGTFVLRPMISIFYLIAISISMTGLGLSLSRWILPISFRDKTVYSFGLGAVVYCLILFFIAVLGIFDYLVIIVFNALVLIASITIYYKKLINIKDFKLSHSSLTPMSFFALSALILYFVISINSVQIPFPAGFDSRNVYLNLANILALNGEFANAFSPHNWGLVAAQGILLYGEEFALSSCSYFPAILIALLSYNIMVSDLKLKNSHGIFATVLILVSPVFSNQLSIEVKYELMLLFIQLITLKVLIHMWKQENIWDELKKDDYKLAIYLGILMGFGLGLKLNNLFMIIVISIMMWKSTDWKSLIGSASLATGLMILVKIDSISGMHFYHNHREIPALLLILVGILFLGLYCSKNIKRSLAILKFSTVMFSMIILLMIPWLTKNYFEVENKLSFELIKGKSPGHQSSATEIIKTYKSLKKADE